MKSLYPQRDFERVPRATWPVLCVRLACSKPSHACSRTFRCRLFYSKFACKTVGMWANRADLIELNFYRVHLVRDTKTAAC